MIERVAGILLLVFNSHRKFLLYMLMSLSLQRDKVSSEYHIYKVQFLGLEV